MRRENSQQPVLILFHRDTWINKTGIFSAEPLPPDESKSTNGLCGYRNDEAHSNGHHDFSNQHSARSGLVDRLVVFREGFQTQIEGQGFTVHEFVNIGSVLSRSPR